MAAVLLLSAAVGVVVCPVCEQSTLSIEVSPAQIERERRLRSEFVDERLGHHPEPLESMDLTRFMHGGPARLLSCRLCGTRLREEGTRPQYEIDAYDTALLDHLYPRYVRAFEQKRSPYRKLLRPGAEVLEVGSHLGAFLEVAEEWGWRPTGLDIGASTSAYAKRQGGSVKRLALEDYAPRLRRPEAIFIWNCFEQLENPSATLGRAHEMLDRGGLLVVRVPNAAFYSQQRRKLDPGRPNRALNLLGYNNLLGFPYLHGYTHASLLRLLRANQFEQVASYNSSLLTPPYPQLSPRVRREWSDVRSRGESLSTVDGPWIEIVSRLALTRRP